MLIPGNVFMKYKLLNAFEFNKSLDVLIFHRIEKPKK